MVIQDQECKQHSKCISLDSSVPRPVSRN